MSSIIDPVDYFFKSRVMAPKLGADIKLSPLNILTNQIVKEFGPCANNIKSYNHYVENIMPFQIRHRPIHDQRNNEFYFDDVEISKPMFEGMPLFPFKARRLGLTYSGEITAKLYRKSEDGSPDVLITNNRIVLGGIPIMLGSKWCHLHGYNSTEIVAVFEDSDDVFGYFIIKGSERTLVSQEKLCTEQQLTNERETSGKIVHTTRITIPSINGTTVMLITVGKKGTNFKFILCQSGMKNSVSRKLPIFVIFDILFQRINPEMYGYDRIYGSKIYDKVYEDSTAKDKRDLIVNEAIDLIMRFVPEEYKASCKIVLISSIAKYLSIKDGITDYIVRKRTKSTTIKDASKQAVAAIPKRKAATISANILDKEDGYDVFADGNDIDNIIDELLNDIFVNVGNIEDKPMHFARLVSQHILCKIEARKSDNRDGWENKRIEVAAGSLSQLFSGIFKGSISVSGSYTPSSNLLDEFVSSFGPKAAWGGRENISDFLKRDTPLALVSQISRMNTPASRQSKQLAMRMLQPSQVGFCCLAETPEGSACGLTKNACCMMWVSLKRDAKSYIKDVLIPSVGVLYEYDKELKPYPILINNIIVGWCDGSEEKALRDNTKRNLNYFDVSVSFNQTDNILEIFTSGSRPTRPLFVVDEERGCLELDNHEGIEMDTEKLIEAGVIQYISAHEQQYIYIVEFPDKVKEKAKNRKNSFLRMYSEIDPVAILSVSTNFMPVANTNQGPRITYQAGMAKQSLGHYHDNYYARFDASFKRMDHPNRSIFETRISEVFGNARSPTGRMLIVAFLALPQNIEDAIIIQHESFTQTTITKYITHKINMRKPILNSSGMPSSEIPYENIEKPETSVNIGIYDTINEDGLPSIGTRITKGKCIIGRTRVSCGEGGVKSVSNISLFAGIGDDGVVDRVDVVTIDDVMTVKVRVRQIRNVTPGDKFASRFSQKGTIGERRFRIAGPGRNGMIRIANGPNAGVVPDIIINPAAMPSRMTIGKLFEMLASAASIINGKRVDATTFGGFNRDSLIDCRSDLIMGGLDPNSYYEVLRPDGTKIKNKIFIAPCCYQILRHNVFDKIQYRSRGNIMQLTHQPVHGRGVEGGLRIGEMERAAILSWGAADTARERLMLASDKYNIEICARCGNVASVNPSLNEKNCTVCKSGDKIGTVTLTYISMLISSILQGMGISMSYQLKEIDTSSSLYV